MVTPAVKREAVAHLKAHLGLSERRACQIAGADRTMVRYQSQRAPDTALRGRLRDLANERRRFGYRRLFVLLRREGEPSGIKGHWAGDRKQTTLWQIANRDQDADTVHGTQKPVECMRRPILNNSSPGQAVFEPFMGSGTMLIAAETTRRVCFGVELNPAYVDVAIERWQSFTGQEAALAETGETFAALKAKRLPA